MSKHAKQANSIFSKAKKSASDINYLYKSIFTKVTNILNIFCPLQYSTIQVF